jgi:endonuclease I
MRNFISVLVIVIACSTQLFADYYDGTAGLAGEELKSALHDIIKDHTQYSYDALKEILKNTDEDPADTNNVILLYTGWSRPKDSFGDGASCWNREHVWAKSHGDFGTSPGAGTDLHHIRPTDVSVNSRRGNLDFDNGGEEYIDGDGPTGCYVDNDSWEPRDAVKGDAARMIFYMAVRYEGDNGEPDLEPVDYIPSSPNNEPYHGRLSTLLEWHTEDPVDLWEQNRNEKIYEWQGNRNPFIDHPEFVSLIWEENSIEEDAPYCIALYASPNPFSTSTKISFNLHRRDAESAEIKIYNIKGQLVKEFKIRNSKLKISGEVVWDGKDESGKQMPSGIYLYRLSAGEESVVKKMILLK